MIYPRLCRTVFLDLAKAATIQDAKHGGLWPQICSLVEGLTPLPWPTWCCRPLCAPERSCPAKVTQLGQPCRYTSSGLWLQIQLAFGGF